MSDKVIDQLSKRIDNNESDIKEIESAVKAIDKTMTAVVDNQKKLEDHLNKVKDTVEPINNINKNKKPIFWIIVLIISLFIGNDVLIMMLNTFLNQYFPQLLLVR